MAKNTIEFNQDSELVLAEVKVIAMKSDDHEKVKTKEGLVNYALDLLGQKLTGDGGK